MKKTIKDKETPKKHYGGEISAEGDWSHITGIDSKKTKNQDPMLPQERIISFSNRFPNSTMEERIREESEKLKDQVNSTDQYLRFANVIIREKMNRLRQLKDDEKRFQEEIDNLQNKIKSRYELDKIEPKQMTPNDAKSLVYHLEDEYERMKDRLLYQELIVQKTKDEIAKKRKQIQQVKDELKDLLHKSTKIEMVDPITVLREELKKAGISESSKIFQAINEISNHLNSKNIEKTHH
jgi:DNA repair exonuclease SbcCD ATPase subunit